MNLTLAEVDERITALDDLIFKIETGQIPASWEEYEARRIEAEALMKVLAENLSSLQGITYKEAFDPRQQIRSLNKISAVVERHIAFHPEDKHKDDPLLIAAVHNGTDGSEFDPQAIEKFISRFNYMFEKCPKPHQEKPKGFFKRLFNGS